MTDSTPTALCPHSHRFTQRCFLCGGRSKKPQMVPAEIAAAYRLGGLSAVIEVIATNRSLYAKQIRWISGESP